MELTETPDKEGLVTSVGFSREDREPWRLTAAVNVQWDNGSGTTFQVPDVPLGFEAICGYRLRQKDATLFFDRYPFAEIASPNEIRLILEWATPQAWQKVQICYEENLGQMTALRFMLNTPYMRKQMAHVD